MSQEDIHITRECVVRRDVPMRKGSRFDLRVGDDGWHMKAALLTLAEAKQLRELLDEHIAFEEGREPELPYELRRWLATGERGVSSLALAAHLGGYKPSPADIARGAIDRRDAHPYDLSDWRRCQLFLEACPIIAKRFATMADVSPTWSALVSAWPNVLALAEMHAPAWREEAQALRVAFPAARALSRALDKPTTTETP